VLRYWRNFGAVRKLDAATRLAIHTEWGTGYRTKACADAAFRLKG
jgi:hypothetical protein